MPPKVYVPEEQARRYSTSEEQLVAAGGKRVNIRLRPKAVKAMRKVMKRHDCDQTEAINKALLGEA